MIALAVLFAVLVAFVVVTGLVLVGVAAVVDAVSGVPATERDELLDAGWRV